MLINIEKETAKQIKKLSLTERESYDEILKRILNKEEKNILRGD